MGSSKDAGGGGAELPDDDEEEADGWRDEDAKPCACCCCAWVACWFSVAASRAGARCGFGCVQEEALLLLLLRGEAVVGGLVELDGKAFGAAPVLVEAE